MAQFVLGGLRQFSTSYKTTLEKLTETKELCSKVFKEGEKVLVIGESNCEFSSKLAQIVGKENLWASCSPDHHIGYNYAEDDFKSNLEPGHVIDDIHLKSLKTSKTDLTPYDKIIVYRDTSLGPQKFATFLTEMKEKMTETSRVVLFDTSSGHHNKWGMKYVTRKSWFTHESLFSFPWTCGETTADYKMWVFRPMTKDESEEEKKRIEKENLDKKDMKMKKEKKKEENQ